MWQWLVPIIEIGIITVMVYYLLSFFWKTRAKDITLGILSLSILYALSIFLDLPVLQNLMSYFVQAAVIGVMIIFQPELRQALSSLIVKAKKFREIEDFDRFLEDLTHSVYRLAERRIGALIVLENYDSLDEYAKKAVKLNAEFTQELIESIFSATTPLHDGGVILRGSTIISAATIFPLADESAHLTKSMGTRHRAGIGVSQVTDALVIVVSEETGSVNIARDGIMTRSVKSDRFKGIIRSVFSKPPEKTAQTLYAQIKTKLLMERP